MKENIDDYCERTMILKITLFGQASCGFKKILNIII